MAVNKAEIRGRESCDFCDECVNNCDVCGKDFKIRDKILCFETEWDHKHLCDNCLTKLLESGVNGN